MKGEDSRRYPQIELVATSVQRTNESYFGRYIEQCIKEIPEEDLQLAKEKGEPAALVIGSNPYRRQVEEHLVAAGVVEPKIEDELSDRERGLEILNEDSGSNLGWRILLAEGEEKVARDRVRDAAEKGVPLGEVIPAEEREVVLKEAAEWASQREQEGERAEAEVPPVRITSFEGAKGMSAQYVFLVGLQSGDMPRNAGDIQDLEICRFLVGMTRTKKKCSILTTARFGQDFKRPSEFLSWIKAERFEKKKIDAEYWKMES